MLVFCFTSVYFEFTHPYIQPELRVTLQPKSKHHEIMDLKLKTLSIAILASATTGTYAQSHTENTSTNESEQSKKEERNVMLNAADANKPREIQIGLPSEDVTVYENGLPAVYSSSVHKLSAHWRSDASLKGTDLIL